MELRELMSMWYHSGRKFEVQILNDDTCELPDYLRHRRACMFDIGRRLPIPVLDLICTSYGFSCTLSFANSPYHVVIPWSAVIGLSCGNTHFISPAKLQELNDSSASSGTHKVTTAGRLPQNPRARALGFRVLKGEQHDAQRTTTPKDSA